MKRRGMLIRGHSRRLELHTIGRKLILARARRVRAQREVVHNCEDSGRRVSALKRSMREELSL